MADETSTSTQPAAEKQLVVECNRFFKGLHRPLRRVVVTHPWYTKYLGRFHVTERQRRFKDSPGWADSILIERVLVRDVYLPCLHAALRCELDSRPPALPVVRRPAVMRQRPVGLHATPSTVAEMAANERHMIFKLARKHASHRDPDLIAQSVMQRALDALKKDPTAVRAEPSDIKRWLYVMTRRTIIDISRSENAARRLPTSGASHGAFGHEIADMPLREMLNKANDALRSEYREAFEFVEVEGLTQAQAAERLGVSQGVVSERVAAAKATLTAILEPDRDDLFRDADESLSARQTVVVDALATPDFHSPDLPLTGEDGFGINA